MPISQSDRLFPSSLSLCFFQCQKTKTRTRQDDNNDSDSDNERFLNDLNFPQFLVVSSTSEDLPLLKLSPFAIQKAFVGIAGNGLKSTKRLRDGSFLIECEEIPGYELFEDGEDCRLPSEGEHPQDAKLV